MVDVSNALEGTNGTAITNANTGGPNQFSSITRTGTGTTSAFDSTRAKAGTTSLKHHLATVASTVYEDWSSAILGTALANGYSRFYIYMTAYPTVTTRIAAYVGAAALRGSLQITTTGTIRTVNSAGSVVATTTGTIPLNTWTRVEFEITGISGTTGTMAARFFSGANLETNTPDTNGSLSNAAQSVGGTIDDFRPGQSSSVTMTTAWDIWYDDIAFSSTAQPGSSVTTTTVSTTRATTWTVTATVGTTRATTWNALAVAAATRATTWGVAASVTASRATTWTVRSAVLTTRATTWNVASTTTTVSTSRVTTWNVLAATNTSRATTWTVGATVSTTRATTFNVAAAVSTTRATTWTVGTPVTTTRATTFNVLATVESARSTTWAVASNAGTGQVGTPTILNGPDTTITRPYTSPTISPAANALVMVVVSNTGSASDTAPKNATDVTSTFSIVGSWAIVQQAANAAASSSTHVWYAVTTSSPGSGTVTINTGASPSASIITIIQLTNANLSTPVVGFVGSTYATATASLTLAQAPAATDMAMTFTTSRNDSTGATLGSTMTALLVNQTNANPSAAQSIQYRTGSTSTTVDTAGLNTVNNTTVGVVVVGAATGLSFVQTTRSTTWNVAAQVASTRATTWNIAAAVQAVRATTWTVSASVSTTRATTWTVRTPVTTTRATTWNVAAGVTSTRSTTWNALSSVATTRATTWNVAGTATTVSTSRATTWAVRATVATTRATLWNVAAPFVNVAVVADMQPGAGANPPPTVVASRVVAWAPSHIIMPGDLANDGTTAQYGYFNTMYGSLKSIIHPVPGNHDWGNTSGNSLTAYNTYWGAQQDAGGSGASGMYSFDIPVGAKTWHVIGFDSDNATNASAVTSNAVPSSGSALYNAISSDLAANTGKNIIAFCHHPRWSDGTATGAGGTNDDTTLTDIWNLLYDNHADIMLVGHCHSYQRFPKFSKTGTADAAGIREFVVGSGGSGLHTLQATGRRSTVSSYQSAAYDQLNSQWFGYLRLVLNEQSYSWDFISQDGTTSLDSGTQTTNLNATTVTTQRSTTWNVAERVTDLTPTTWNVLTPVTVTRATTWTVATTAATTRATTWVVRAAVASTRATTWNVAGTATTSRATTWQVSATAATSRATTWTVSTTAATSRATTWTVAAQVTSSRATTWNVAGALTQVTTTRATTWTVRAAVTSSRATTWNVAAALTTVATTRATTWNVNAVVAATRSTTWTVSAAVATTRATTWAVAAAVSSSRSTTWTVAATITSSRATTWNVLSPLTNIVTSRATTWTVRAVAQTTRATTWTVTTTVGTVTRSTTWQVLTSAATSRATSWVVRAQVTSTASTLWTVRATISTSRATTWAVWVFSGTATRSTTWRVLTTVATARSTTWAVDVVLQTVLVYAFTGPTTDRYDVTGPLTDRVDVTNLAAGTMDVAGPVLV